MSVVPDDIDERTHKQQLHIQTGRWKQAACRTGASDLRIYPAMALSAVKSGDLQLALSTFLRTYKIDLSESASKFELCFRLATHAEEPEMLLYLMQATPLVTPEFHYVQRRPGTRGRTRLKMNKEFLVGEFEKQTGSHLDQPEVKEMLHAMKALGTINSGKLLKIVDKYYAVQPVKKSAKSGHAHDDDDGGGHFLLTHLWQEAKETFTTRKSSEDAFPVLDTSTSFSDFVSISDLKGGRMTTNLEKESHRKGSDLADSHSRDDDDISLNQSQVVSHEQGLKSATTSPTCVTTNAMEEGGVVTSFVSKSIDSVFSLFLVWHAAIIAAGSGDARSVKNLLLLQGRLDSSLTKLVIPKVAKAGFSEISRTLFKLRTFMHSTMSDILVKLVAESGNDYAVFELVRGSASINFSVSQSCSGGPTPTPVQSHSPQNPTGMCKEASITTLDMSVLYGGAGRKRIEAGGMAVRRRLSFQDLLKNRCLADSAPSSRWNKFHMWEYGLWEFQLVVPVLLMAVEADSNGKASSGMPSTSQDSFPGYQHRQAQKAGEHGNLSGLYSSGSEVSGRFSSTLKGSLSAKDSYERTPVVGQKQTMVLGISSSSKHLHNMIKNKLPKLGFLRAILPSKNSYRYRNLKPLARQSVHLHVQLKVATREVEGTAYAGKKFLEMTVGIDNVRCRVENAALNVNERNYKVGHFVSLIEISLVPVSCSSEDVSVSLTRSSNNQQFEVTLNDSVAGGGGLTLGMSTAADLSLTASKTTSSAVTSTPWRFEQFEVGTIGGGFSWTLHSREGRPFDRLSPPADIGNLKKPSFFHSKLAPPASAMMYASPFNVSDGGVIFAGTDYPNVILWRFREAMAGATVGWEIKGEVHTSFVAGTGFWETRVEEFREVFQHQLVVKP